MSCRTVAAADRLRCPGADCGCRRLGNGDRRPLGIGPAALGEVRREQYVAPWLPEPIVQRTADPADRVTLDEQVSYALLVVLEALTPAERTAWVLHDLFGVGSPRSPRSLSRANGVEPAPGR